MFINRIAELANLERLYQSNATQLFVLYGRRRVGKTELLRAFCEDKPHIFFVATLSSDSDQLATFSQALWQYTHDETPEGFSFPSWEAAFQQLATLPGRPIVVLDEITYLFEGNKTIASILQKTWDSRLRTANLFLVLCGSYVGVVEREILGYQAPLYGRRTASEQLQPLSLPETSLFFPNYSAIQRIETWSVLGGMPYYLSIFSDQQTIFENIRTHILNVRGTLHNEPQLLLMEELREPRNYFSLLRAIAEGKRRLNEITLAAGIGDGRATSRFIDILTQMQVTAREVPVDERNPQKSRKGLYLIRDSFLRFWFRFVHPNQGILSLELDAAVLQQRVLPHFDQFVSYAFEEAAQAYLANLARKGRLSFLPERIGKWWNAQEEIDVAVISDMERTLLVGECKWSNKPVGTNVLIDLQRKTNALHDRERWEHVQYVLFSKSGFTPDLRALASQESILLVIPEQMVSDE